MLEGSGTADGNSAGVRKMSSAPTTSPTLSPSLTVKAARASGANNRTMPRFVFERVQRAVASIYVSVQRSAADKIALIEAEARKNIVG